MKEIKSKATTDKKNNSKEKQQRDKEKTAVPDKNDKQDTKNGVSRHPTTEPNPEG
jgi:hypothetical protein